MGSYNLGSSNKNFLQKLDYMPSLDLATVAVLFLNLYILWNQLGTRAQDNVFGFSTELEIVAVQATAVILVIYAIEALADYKAKD